MQYKARTFTIPNIAGLSNDQITVHLGLYEGYVKHVNILDAELSKLAAAGDEHLYAVGELRKRLGFEWNGMRLHELYFEQISGAATQLTAEMPLFEALHDSLGGFSRWYESFRTLTGRGPGWALLTYDTVYKSFQNVWVEDHQVGQLAGVPIVLALDHWEHAYMVDYRPAEKMKYVDAYVGAINWETVAKRFDAIAA